MEKKNKRLYRKYMVLISYSGWVSNKEELYSSPTAAAKALYCSVATLIRYLDGKLKNSCLDVQGRTIAKKGAKQ